MPRYTFLNTKSNQVEEHYFGITHYDSFVSENPHLQRYHEPGQAAAMGDPVRLGIRTHDDGFREVLSKIGRNNYKSNLGNKLSRR